MPMPLVKRVLSASAGGVKALHTAVSLAPVALADKSSINKQLLDMSYPVRGPLLKKKMEIESDMARGKKFSFDDIIECNIGNPQALGQQPISFARQVLSAVVNPSLMEVTVADGKSLYKPDVIARAKKYLESIPCEAIGAYSTSQGIPAVRDEVAEFIKNRDGYSSDAGDIFLTDGATQGVTQGLRLLIRDENDAVLIPFPQYPLYSALMTLFNGHQGQYLLDESKGWDTNLAKIKESVSDAQDKGKTVRALVVINPGNPTGAVLGLDTMKEIVKLCHTENIVLLADEVYQENIYTDGKPFISFKKVVRLMEESGELPGHKCQLVSYHSISKGVTGECGFRGGYYEVYNIPEDVKDEMIKMASVSLCSNVTGQILTGLMVSPPGGESQKEYQKERDAIFNSLKSRAAMVSERLDKIEGISCNPIEGALYAFASIKLPQGAIDEAENLETAADFLYCMRLLEDYGVLLVPGSGFGQEEGTLHFRTTILPQGEKLEECLDRITKHQAAYLIRDFTKSKM